MPDFISCVYAKEFVLYKPISVRSEWSSVTGASAGAPTRPAAAASCPAAPFGLNYKVEDHNNYYMENIKAITHARTISGRQD